MNSYVNQINQLTDSSDLVEANLKFALKEAHKYKNYGMSLEDLVQEANFGLIKAAEKYDPEKGVKFISFAVHYIRKYIKAALGRNCSLISESSSHQCKVGAIKKAVAHYKEKGKTPTVQDIVKFTKLSKKVIEKTINLSVNGVVSINAKVGDDDTTYEDITDYLSNTPTPEESVAEKDEYVAMYAKLDELSEVEKEAVKLRFFEDYTLEEIGSVIQYTPAGVKAVIDRALKKMRN